jgi:hypothetical protein
MEDEEALENLRRALLGDGTQRWMIEFLPRAKNPTMRVEMGPKAIFDDTDPFGSFSVEVGTAIRKDPLIRGVHIILTCRETAARRGIVASKASKVALKREMELEGATFNESRSKIESRASGHDIMAFSFSDVSEVEEIAALSQTSSDRAKFEKEQEMKEFRMSELTTFIEDNIRLRIYLDREGFVRKHIFAFK